MPYTPENNPYIPGDPYSYDLKWMIQQIKAWKDPEASAAEAKASALEAKGFAEDAAGSAEEARNIAENLEYDIFSNEEVVFTVGTGAQYSKPSEAITAAVNAGKNRAVLFILPGLYNDNITLIDNTIFVTLIGLGEVVIQSDVDYPLAPIYVNYDFIAFNIKFISTSSGSPAAYAFHHEQATGNYTATLEFYNCEFQASNNSAVGMGIGDATVEFHNCTFANLSSYYHSLYAHNAATGNNKSGNLIVDNCRAIGRFRVDDAATYQSLNNKLYILAVNNYGFTDFSFYDYNTTKKYLDTNLIGLMTESRNNNLVALNNDEKYVSFSLSINARTASSAYIMFKDADKYAFTNTFIGGGGTISNINRYPYYLELIGTGFPTTSSFTVSFTAVPDQ